MSSNRRVLGLATPLASTDTDLVDVGTATSYVISTVFICNTNTGQVKFRLWVTAANDVAGPDRYLYYDKPIPGNDTFAITCGITLGSTSGVGDILSCQVDTANVDFSAFGEATP